MAFEQLYFSQILDACLEHGTEIVSEYVEQKVIEKENLSKVIEIEPSPESRVAIEQSDESEHSDDEKLSCFSTDEGNKNNQQHTQLGRKPTNLSLDIESLLNNEKRRKESFNHYSQRENGVYGPSSFQNAILWHMDWQRKFNGNKIGLIIMATGMGKTILAILDIERELYNMIQENTKKTSNTNINKNKKINQKKSKMNKDTIVANNEMEIENDTDANMGGKDDSDKNEANKNGGYWRPRRRFATAKNIDLRKDSSNSSNNQNSENRSENNENVDSNNNGCQLEWYIKGECPCKCHCEINLNEIESRKQMIENEENSNDNKNLNKNESEFCLLFIVHTKAIRNGAFLKFKKHFQSLYHMPNDLFVKIESSTTNFEIRKAKFIFCLFQSFDRLLNYHKTTVLKKISHVIIDEVHHLLAQTWLTIDETLKNQQICPSLQYYLGMTATLQHRTDPKGIELKKLFNNAIYIQFPWNIAKQLNYFPDVEYLEAMPTLAKGRDIATYHQLLTLFQQNLNNLNINNNNNNGKSSKRKRSNILNNFLNRLESSIKRYSNSTNSFVLNNLLTPEYVVNILLTYQKQRMLACAQNNNVKKKEKILIFAKNANDASKIADILNNKHNIKSGAIHYKINQYQTSKILNSFCNGNLQCLVNVNVVNEGFDLPSVDCVVLARQTKSEIVFVQQIGRGLRKDLTKSKKFQEKSVCILDLAFNLRRRWRLLQMTLTDQQVIDNVLQFWHVSNFVGVSYA